MSRITNCFLCITGSFAREKLLKMANAYFDEQEPDEPRERFVDAFDKKDSHGGRYAMECLVFAGAFNYLDLDALVRSLRAQLWLDYIVVQLLVNDDYGGGMRVFPIYGTPEYAGPPHLAGTALGVEASPPESNEQLDMLEELLSMTEHLIDTRITIQDRDRWKAISARVADLRDGEDV